MDPTQTEDEDLSTTQDETLDPSESLDSDENLDEEGEDNTPAKPKNKSNFKKLSIANKEKEKRIKELEKKLSEYEPSDDESNEDEDSDEEEDDTDDEDKPISTRYSPMEIQIKLLKDPEAAKLETQIRAAFKKYPNMTFADAKAFAKASIPAESETKKALGLKTNASKAKGLAALSEEEALKLEPAEYLKWGRETGKIKG